MGGYRSLHAQGSRFGRHVQRLEQRIGAHEDAGQGRHRTHRRSSLQIVVRNALRREERIEKIGRFQRTTVDRFERKIGKSAREIEITSKESHPRIRHRSSIRIRTLVGEDYVPSGTNRTLRWIYFGG